MAKERRRRRRDRKDGAKKLELELSKKIAAIVNEGVSQDSAEKAETSEPTETAAHQGQETGKPEAAAKEAEKPEQEPAAPQQDGSQKAEENEPAESVSKETAEPPGTEEKEARPRSRTMPPKAPEGALEEPEKGEAEDSTTAQAKVVRLPERKPRERQAPKPRPRPKRRKGDRRAPGSPVSDFADLTDVEAKMALNQKLLGYGKIALIAAIGLFFGWFGKGMVTSRSLYNERVDAAREIQNRINNVFNALDKVRKVFERKKTANKRFTRELVDLAVKKGPDNISKEFVKDLAEIERRLKLMHPQTVSDIIDFHTKLTAFAEAVKEHVQALDKEDWQMLLKYANASKKIPPTETAIVTKPPPPRKGLDILLEKGEPVIIQEVVRKRRNRVYKVHKVGQDLPVYELSSDQLEIVKLGDYIKDPLHEAIDKYERTESKVTSLLDDLMKTRTSLLNLVQKFASEEKLSEF